VEKALSSQIGNRASANVCSSSGYEAAFSVTVSTLSYMKTAQSELAITDIPIMEKFVLMEM